MAAIPIASGEITLTRSSQFDGGNILWASDLLSHKLLGIIFYIGEVLSKVFVFGFCFPVSEALKNRAIEIVSKKEPIEPDLVENPLITSLKPQIDEQFGKISRKAQWGTATTKDLEDAMIEIMGTLEERGDSPGKEEIQAQAEPIFCSLIKELQETFDVDQILQSISPNDMKQRLFFRSIQEGKILELEGTSKDLIEEKAQEIRQKISDGTATTKDLEEATIVTLVALSNEGPPLTDEKIHARVKSIFLSLIQELQKTVDIKQSLQELSFDDSIDKWLFFRSIQKGEILELEDTSETVKDKLPQNSEVVTETDTPSVISHPMPQRASFQRTLNSWAPTIFRVVHVANVAAFLYSSYLMISESEEDSCGVNPSLPMGRYAYPNSTLAMGRFA